MNFLYHTSDRGPTSYALPSEVWVFGRALGHAPDMPVEPGERGTSASEAPDVPRESAPEERLTDLEASAEQDHREALQQALSDPDQTVQRRAFELLIMRDGPGTIALLAHMAQSEDPATRMPALFLLYDAGLADPAVPLESVLAGEQQVILQEPSE